MRRSVWRQRTTVFTQSDPPSGCSSGKGVTHDRSERQLGPDPPSKARRLMKQISLAYCYLLSVLSYHLRRAYSGSSVFLFDYKAVLSLALIFRGFNLALALLTHFKLATSFVIRKINTFLHLCLACVRRPLELAIYLPNFNHAFKSTPVRSIVMPHATSAASASTQTGTSKRTSWHRRTKSLQEVPLIHSSSTSHDEFASVPHPSNKPWQFDVESDEEVPAPTILEAAVRRSIAKAHVESKLGRLGVESAAERQQSGASWSPASRWAPHNHEDILLIGEEDSGILCPSSWRTTGLEGVLLDRTWLHEVNPFAFDGDGVLRAPHLYMKKPKSVPLLYWKWIKDDIPIHGQPERWAEGWTIDGPTVVWVKRWRDGELTAKEINGRRRVGFKLDEDVFEI